MIETWTACLPDSIKKQIALIPERLLSKMEEVRIREGRPIEIGFRDEYRFINDEGDLGKMPKVGYLPTKLDCLFILEMLTEHSLYSYQEQLQKGYITLRGGHRVGIVGQTTVESGKVRLLKDVSGFNIRIAREVVGCSRPLLRGILDQDAHNVHNTLIISPPQQGKTTLLRDFSRQISDGDWPSYVNWPSRKVGIVDERSELAACVQGVPTFQVGARTDVLDGCPKAEGMMMMVRSMSPHVIVVDEIGRDEDAIAIDEVAHAGIRILCSAHGFSLEDIRKRPMFRRLLESGIFQRYLVIGHNYAQGNIYRIYDGNGKELHNHILQRNVT